MKTNWQTKKLSDVCDFQRGLTYSKKDEVDFSENIVLRSNNIELLSSSLDLNELRYINNKILIPNNKRVKKGSLIICTANGSKSHLGKIALVDKDYGYAFGGFMGQLVPRKEINSKYFFYILTSDLYKNHLEKISSGANINNLKFSDLSEFEIPLPPLPEQHRIVKILDEVFEQITKAKENTEKNLQNAKELFESYLQGVFTNPGEDWEECELSKYVKFIDYRGRTPKKTTSGLRLITAKNIKMGFLQRHPEEFIDPKGYNTWMTRGIPKKGDVLFTTEAPLANVAQLDTDEKVAFAQRTIIFQTDSTKLDSTFLKYLLLSVPVQKKILEKGTGATVKGIKASLLKKILISFPSLSEQKSIVARLDALSAETKKLEAIYQQKLDNLEELKKSVLKKAFAGELVE